ncbi:MAG: hypothetical protein EXS40_03010 [Opitutaceae bacterium]|nr:hypothetical protein [Opitutaceae bacterium]
MNAPRLLPILAAVALLATACSKSDHAAHDHDKKSAHSAHVHSAPHGGTLVEIGDHAYNLELVRDSAAGTLTAYVLDGHAENFVRIASLAIELIAMPSGQYTPLTLRAVANPSTGETIGDTSQFAVQADWLKTAADFSGIFTVEIKGTKFEQVPYHLPKQSPPPRRPQLG